MEENSVYPNLDLLFGGYLNQDCEYIGSTIQEVVLVFKNGITPAMNQASLLEIDRFKHDHPNDLDEAFKAAYGYDFSPELWGYTTASFLDELKRLLQQ